MIGRFRAQSKALIVYTASSNPWLPSLDAGLSRTLRSVVTALLCRQPIDRAAKTCKSNTGVATSVRTLETIERANPFSQARPQLYELWNNPPTKLAITPEGLVG